MITKQPIVGAILLKQGTLTDQTFTMAGVITKVTDGQVRYTTPEGKETFTPIRQVTAVCDTQEEATNLIAFSNGVVANMQKIRRKVMAAEEEFFTK